MKTKRKTKSQRIQRIAREAYKKILPNAAKFGWSLNSADWNDWKNTPAQKQWKAAVKAIIEILDAERIPLKNVKEEEIRAMNKLHILNASEEGA
jgi:hypothetical protein